MSIINNYYIKTNCERQEKEYWIDRNGWAHKYKGSLDEEIVSMHSQIADDLFPDIEYAADYLRKIGWIIIGSTVYSTPIMDKKPTIAQINKLKNLNLFEFLHVLVNGKYLKYVENI